VWQRNKDEPHKQRGSRCDKLMLHEIGLFPDVSAKQGGYCRTRRNIIPYMRYVQNPAKKAIRRAFSRA
jgi:hypothetical protein